MRTQTKTKTWETMRRTARRVLPVAVLATGAALASPQASVSAVSTTETWGPTNRATFKWDAPADHVTFNSITDNPSLGDERNFVRIRKAGTNDKYSDSVNLEVGAEYEVYIYYHNNASASLNESGKGMAQNVRLRMEQPATVYKDHAGELKGIISSTNSDPKEVWDTAYVRTSSTVLLRYVANSATIHNGGNANGQVISSEAMFGKEGAKIAWSTKYWGFIPGCNEFAGYVTYRFKVDQPRFEMSKTAAKENEQTFGEEIVVKPGEKIDFKIDYKNTGTVNQLDIKVYDQMPDGLAYIPGTSFFKASVNKEGSFVSDKLFDGGINLGDYKPGDSMWITYKVEVKDDDKIFPCGDTVVYNNSSVATANGTGHDKVKITVRRDCEPEKVEKCKKVNDTYFGKEGKIVDKATYDKECGPAELPKTGPTEIVLALVIISGIGIGGAYYYSSKKQLKELENK